MNVDEVIDDFRFDLHERTVTPEAGVVDQQREGLVTGDARLNPREGAGVGEVGREDRRAIRTRSYPSRANRSAYDAPMPEDAPVTTARGLERGLGML